MSEPFFVFKTMDDVQRALQAALTQMTSYGLLTVEEADLLLAPWPPLPEHARPDVSQARWIDGGSDLQETIAVMTGVQEHPWD
jgi:hypothetical protein